MPRSLYVDCVGRELHCVEWGNPLAPVLVAWHGLARTARDMDDWRPIWPAAAGA